MRKAILAITVGFILLLFTGVNVSADNLVENPGFEDSLNYWDPFQYPSGWSSSSDNPHSGSSCAKFGFPAGSGYYDASIRSSGYQIPVEAGYTYLFYFWIRERDTRDTNDPNKTIVDPGINLNGTWYAAPMPSTSETWQYIDTLITFSESGNAVVNFQLHGYATSNEAEFAVDDVNLSIDACLECNAISQSNRVPNVDGTIIWDLQINNCGFTSIPVYAEIYPTVGDCASGTQYDFNINRLAVSNLGAGDSATLYYWYRPGTVTGVIDAAINIDIGPAIDNYISNCCFEFIFAYEFGRPGSEISFGPGEWGERGEEVVLPSTTSLMQNYPNPFNASTTISFDIAQIGDVNLSVYNLMGQKIETLIDNKLQAGHHNIIWDASTYSSGVYFYKLTTDGKTFTKRMTLLK